MRRAPWVSITVLSIIIFAAFVGPLWVHHSPYTLGAHAILEAPSWEHWMGTDRLGRDLFVRMLYGGQVSLIIGVGSALLATLIGLIFGVTAAFLRGKMDLIFVIVVDLFLTFPTLFLLLALLSYVHASIVVLVVVIAVTGWMTTARLIRAQSFEIASKPYIKIFSLAKLSQTKLLFKYILPLLMPIVLIAFTFGVSGAILSESALSFLGLGIMPPQMSWGLLLSDAQELLDVAWWLSLFPGLAIFAVTYALINISDYLQYRANTKEQAA